MSANAGGDWRTLKRALRNRIQHLRDKWGQRTRLRRNTDCAPEEEAQETMGMVDASAPETLPINVKLYIMTFLTPKELLSLGRTNFYWRITVQDPLIWRYFLMCDLPSWNSIDWESLPDAKIFNQPCVQLDNIGPCSFMAAYKKCYSFHKSVLKPNRTAQRTLYPFIRSLITTKKTSFAIFGPGLDQSLEQSIMESYFLPLAAMHTAHILRRGSSVAFHLNGQDFNIQILYLKPRKERQRAKAHWINQNAYLSKRDMKKPDELLEHVQNLCRLVDGFIYVADAGDHKRHNRQIEFTRMSAMLDPTFGPSDRPLLIVSCISCASKERIPCVYLAHQLQLNLLDRPWMVQDAEGATMVGLMDGIQWLLEHVKR